MRLSESIALLLKSCPLLENTRVAAEVFDERLGGVGVFENGERTVYKKYCDGSKIIAENVKLTFSVGEYGLAESVCEWLSCIGEGDGICFGKYPICGIDTGNIKTVGKTGFERLETECIIKYLKGT